MRRLALLLTALLACGLIAAGCGDDDGDDGDDSAATTESAPADTTDTTEAEDDSGGATSPDDVDSIDEAVQACKDNVQATAGQLSEGLRSDLEELCDKAAEGDEEDLQEASREICRKVVEETVPEESGARDQALASCESAGG
jgi:hypothetical protein